MAEERRKPSERERERSQSRSSSGSDGDYDDGPSIELAFAREPEDGLPAICNSSWSLWDGGQAGGKPVRPNAQRDEQRRRTIALPRSDFAAAQPHTLLPLTSSLNLTCS